MSRHFQKIVRPIYSLRATKHADENDTFTQKNSSYYRIRSDKKM
jgi:hypothetical protein